MLEGESAQSALTCWTPCGKSFPDVAVEGEDKGRRIMERKATLE